MCSPKEEKPESVRMPRRTHISSLPCLLIALTMWPGASAFAQERTLTDPSDFGPWESLGRSVISPMGDWVAYQVSRNDGDAELRIWGRNQDSTIVVPWASNPVFSPDGRWLAWTSGYSEEDEEASDVPLLDGVEVLDLTQPSETQAFADVARAEIDPTGRWLALLAHRPEDGSGGATLRIVELETGVQTSFGSVGEVAWSDPGTILAMTIESGADEGNGLQVYDADHRPTAPPGSLRFHVLRPRLAGGQPGSGRVPVRRPCQQR